MPSSDINSYGSSLKAGTRIICGIYSVGLTILLCYVIWLVSTILMNTDSTKAHEEDVQWTTLETALIISLVVFTLLYLIFSLMLLLGEVSTSYAHYSLS